MCRDHLRHPIFDNVRRTVIGLLLSTHSLLQCRPHQQGDEIYLRAERPVPSRKHYGDYPQIEDGVGMVRSFTNDFNVLWRRLMRRPPPNAAQLNGTVLTGMLFAPVLRQMFDRVNNRFGTRLKVVPVENRYFGGDATVAGLMTGSDILAVRARLAGEFVVLPSVAVKSDEPVMLDGMKLEELQTGISIPVCALDFAGFARMLK